MSTQLFPKAFVISKVIQRIAHQTGLCLETIESCFDDFASFDLERKSKVSFDEVNRAWEESALHNLQEYLYS
jgi:hypothetical protein